MAKNLSFWKKNTKYAEAKTDREDLLRAGQKDALNLQFTHPTGSRIGFVMDRMYRLVVSVDLDLDSCYIECGKPAFSSLTLQKVGRYSDFVKNVSQLVTDAYKERITNVLRINSVTDCFREGKSWLSEIIPIDGTLTEVRVERIPELDPRSQRARCCVFFRPVRSMEDNGWSSGTLGAPGIITQQESENEKIIAAIYTGAYEISVEQNVLIGFEKRDGIFARPGERCPLVSTVKAWIENGIIHPDSAEAFKDMCRPGFLKKKTLEGRYLREVQLKAPGAVDYRWYEETVFPLGDNFLIYRKDINLAKRQRDDAIREEEQNRFDKYNTEMLEMVAGLVEFRNTETGDHIKRVQEVTRILLEDLAERSPQYGLTPKTVRLYVAASILHDIGKITISDVLLNKAGHLTPEERKSLQAHTVNGAMIIDRMSSAGHEEQNLCSRDVVLHHHERYDGNGYPEGLKGDEISIGAQVVGLADAFDALSSARAYKEAYSCEKSMEMLEAGECGVFQPRLLESLRNCFDKVRAVYEPH